MVRSPRGSNGIAGFLVAAGVFTASGVPPAHAAAPALTIEAITRLGAQLTNSSDVAVRALDGSLLRQGVRTGDVLPDDVQVSATAGAAVRIGAAGIGSVTIEGAEIAFHYTGSVESVAMLGPGRVEVDDPNRIRFFGPGFQLSGYDAGYAVELTGGRAKVTRTSGVVIAKLLGSTAFVRRVDVLSDARPAIAYTLGAETSADVPVDDDRAAAASGAANGEYNLGMRLYWGDGVTADAAGALRYFQAAAAQRFGEAENAIGYIDVYGPPVMQDTAQASRWFLLAAADGSAAAEDTLGDMYDYGHGVAQSYAQAMHWYQASAAQGDADAENDIGLLYYLGRAGYFDDASPEYAEALRWFRIAAAQGNGDAENDIGYAYEHGHGVPQDDAQALHWYRLAAAHGVAPAAAAIRRIESLPPR